ncbi:hypothetical protein Mapa_016208 [Marchantia paleacea]|nr:hypothetical protein Mapa_016208 [Marchantia paleacea]
MVLLVKVFVAIQLYLIQDVGSFPTMYNNTAQDGDFAVYVSKYFKLTYANKNLNRRVYTSGINDSYFTSTTSHTCCRCAQVQHLKAFSSTCRQLSNARRR